MKSVFRILPAASLALGLALSMALSGLPAFAQPQPGQPSIPGLKPATPAALAAAKEILAMKNTAAMYQAAVPNVVQQTEDTLIQANLNYEKDLSEVAVIIAKNLAGSEKEIGDGMALVYANEFTEQELTALVAFYKSPLGQKLLVNEPRAIQLSMSYMNQWVQQFAEIVNGEFRSEMRKRGKPI
jgi:uncharacterized protein